MLKKLKETAPQLKKIIEEMEYVADALIEFAYTTYESCQESNRIDTYVIPSNLKIQKIKNYTNALLPTCKIGLRINCNYDDVVGKVKSLKIGCFFFIFKKFSGIHSYSKEFEKVGGINNPKRLFCRGTDGIMRSQLLKGRDDLRQDAVMEQVFENINVLLHANKQTKDLLIRTYKVSSVIVSFFRSLLL